MGTFRSLALVAVLFAAGCAGPRDPRLGEDPSAIQGGFSDGRDDAVVGVALVDGSGYVRRACSGTLIAPNLVLTAQHCVADTAPFVDCRSSVFGPLVDARRIHVTTSASMWSSDADWLPATEVIPPPGARTVCGRDVALVLLASSVDDRRATPIPPRLDVGPERQEGYAAVGYGATRGDADDAGLRRRRDALRVVCVGDACSSGQVEEDEWRGDHGICNGDSGGPALDREGFVIGVTSRGPTGCEDPIYGGLVGHAAWLREAVQSAARGGAYTVPSWTTEDPEESHGASYDDARPAAGCAATGAGRGEGAAWLVAALVLIAARRRQG